MRQSLVASTLVLLGCLSPPLAATEATPPPAEVRQLQSYVGKWSALGEMRMEPAAPFKPISGDETCSWAAGGYAVLCQERIQGPGGGWEGVYILSYDAETQQYHVHGTEAPGTNMHATGRLDGERWVWFTDPAPDGSRMRYTFAPLETGARSMTVEAAAGDDWTVIVSVTYTPGK